MEMKFSENIKLFSKNTLFQRVSDGYPWFEYFFFSNLMVLSILTPFIQLWTAFSLIRPTANIYSLLHLKLENKQNRSRNVSLLTEI